MRITTNGSIALENHYIRLVIGQTGVAESLVYKNTGEELLAIREQLPLFSLSQKRPFNNEVKLAHMNKHTTYPATDL